MIHARQQTASSRTCCSSGPPLNRAPRTASTAAAAATRRGCAAVCRAAPGDSRSSSPSSSFSLSSGDEVDLQLQQAAQFQLAHQNQTLSFGFSAGGLLFPYYLGVAQQLRDMNLLRDDTQLAGASAGSLIAACIKSGMSFATLKGACFELARDCRDNGTRHRLKHVLEGTLRDMLPADVAERCNGQVHVAVTRLTPGLQPSLVSHFNDREDLIAALLTSCHIPWYFDGSLVTSFRKTPCFDGGITNFLPNIPGTTTCRVCCLPRQQLAAIRNISISPDAFDVWPYNIQQMLNWALEPADEEQLLMFIECGRRDAKLWAELTGLAALGLGLGAANTDGSVSSSGDDVQLPNVPRPREGVVLATGVGAEGEQPVGTSLLGLMRTLITYKGR